MPDMGLHPATQSWYILLHHFMGHWVMTAMPSIRANRGYHPLVRRRCSFLAALL